jgi:hypothetical protein
MVIDVGFAEDGVRSLYEWLEIGDFVCAAAATSAPPKETSNGRLK